MDELLIKDTFQRLYKEHKFMKECGLYNHEINKLLAEEFYRTGYNKAIDDFAERISVYGTFDYHGNTINVLEIAEQMKME